MNISRRKQDVDLVLQQYGILNYRMQSTLDSFGFDSLDLEEIHLDLEANLGMKISSGTIEGSTTVHQLLYLGDASMANRPRLF